jgi:hypothetical protein
MGPCSAHSWQPFHPLFTVVVAFDFGSGACWRQWIFLVFGSDTEQTLFNLCDRVLRVPDASPASEEMVAPAHPPPEAISFYMSHGAHFRHIWPAKIGSRILCAVVARRTALPCFRRRIAYRGRYGSRAFRKALGLCSPNMALAFAALRATHPWNSSKAA